MTQTNPEPLAHRSGLSLVAKHEPHVQPSHPSAVLRKWLDDLTVTKAAESLQVSRVTLSKILNGNGCISADMALRLSQWLGTSPDVRLGMQNQYDLWQAGQSELAGH